MIIVLQMDMVVVTQCHTNHHKHVLLVDSYAFLYSVYNLLYSMYIPLYSVCIPCIPCTSLYSVYILNSVCKDTTDVESATLLSDSSTAESLFGNHNSFSIKSTCPNLHFVGQPVRLMMFPYLLATCLSNTDCG